MISSDQDFVLKFLFNIDTVVQRFFRHLLSHSIGFQATNILSELTDMFVDIGAFKFHGPFIPCDLLKLVRPKHQPVNQKQPSSDPASGAPKRRKVKNEYKDSRWSLRSGEDFEMFYSQKTNVPSILQTPICLKYHIIGNCTSSCPRAATHIPLTGDTASQMMSFVNNCRSSSTSTAPGGQSGQAAAANTNPPAKRT